MYHEVTTKELASRRKRRITALLMLVVLLVASVVLVRAIQRGAREQGAAAMRQSILDAAVRCCAVEGSYPFSLSHLEQSYGLRVNHEDYIITYEAYATNMVPSVVVVPR